MFWEETWGLVSMQLWQSTNSAPAEVSTVAKKFWRSLVELSTAFTCPLVWDSVTSGWELAAPVEGTWQQLKLDLSVPVQVSMMAPEGAQAESSTKSTFSAASVEIFLYLPQSRLYWCFFSMDWSSTVMSSFAYRVTKKSVSSLGGITILLQGLAVLHHNIKKSEKIIQSRRSATGLTGTAATGLTGTAATGLTAFRYGAHGHGRYGAKGQRLKGHRDTGVQCVSQSLEYRVRCCKVMRFGFIQFQSIGPVNTWEIWFRILCSECDKVFCKIVSFSIFAFIAGTQYLSKIQF
ncbi:Hypothetical_protein [Hexamita inflata]|uniref:Hypothetical_protein n=1 Tax=Hexamita inflata TaxID=28002 RepID=A0AA86UZ30_9EUKA|nr:Hypothetical protein HINF_LOCUS61499 [Hexamita inflata]